MPGLHQRHLTALAAVAATALGAAACTHADPSPPAFLPRHANFGGGAAAIVGGTLVVQVGCILFETEAGLVLPVWPADARVIDLDGVLAVTDGAGRVVAEGEQAFFGGGYIDLAFAAELSGGPIPEACRVPEAVIVNDLDPVAIP